VTVLGRRLVEALDQAAGRRYLARQADDPKHVAAVVDLDTHAAFDLAQVLVELATQVRQAPVVRRV